MRIDAWLRSNNRWNGRWNQLRLDREQVDDVDKGASTFCSAMQRRSTRTLEITNGFFNLFLSPSIGILSHNRRDLLCGCCLVFLHRIWITQEQYIPFYAEAA